MMKKAITTLAMTALLTMGSLNVRAQYDGFLGGDNSDGGNGLNFPVLPMHESPGNQGATPTAPLGSGLLILGALGAGYALAKRKEER